MLGRMFELGSLHKVVQETTDGALARYYRCHEWSALCSEFFRVEEIHVSGAKMEMLPMPAGY